MKRKRFSEEQIIGILKEHEAGIPVSDLCRKHGVSDASIYKWKARYGGLDVSEAKRLKQLEDENSKLKKLLADAMLDNAMLKDITSKKCRRCISIRRRHLLSRKSLTKTTFSCLCGLRRGDSHRRRHIRAGMKTLPAYHTLVETAGRPVHSPRRSAR